MTIRAVLDGASEARGCALEAALELKDSSGGELHVVWCAAGDATGAARKAIAAGADRAVQLVVDVRGKDPRALGVALGRLIGPTGPSDVTLCSEGAWDARAVAAELAAQVGDPVAVAPSDGRRLRVPHARRIIETAGVPVPRFTPEELGVSLTSDSPHAAPPSDEDVRNGPNATAY